MTIVPYVSANATRSFAASAQSHAPVVDDTPSTLVGVWHEITRH